MAKRRRPSRTNAILAAANGAERAPDRPVSVDGLSGQGLRGTIRFELLQRSIEQVSAPVLVVSRYDGTPAVGAMRPLDIKLGGWLKSGIERGIIAPQLGELNYIPVTRGQLQAEGVIIAGMGEVGRFNREELRYLSANIVLAILNLGYTEMGTVLIGTGGGALLIPRALRAMTEGIFDAFDFYSSPHPELKIKLALRRPEAIQQVEQTIAEIAEEIRGGRAKLFVRRGPALRGKRAKSVSDTVSPQNEESRSRITATREEIVDTKADSPTKKVCFNYAAISNSATVPMRAQEVQAYFVDRIPDYLRGAHGETKQIEAGRVLARYLIPEDIRQMIQSGDPLTLIVDASTAVYPWEMASYTLFNYPRFYGTDLRLTRQFRTAATAIPGLTMPLNRHLKVLLVADPAPGKWKLPGARREAVAVSHVLRDAVRAAKGTLRIELTARVGHPEEPDTFNLLNEIKELAKVGDDQFKVDVRECRPIELLSLLFSQTFDVLHYAGHGVFDPNKRRSGWRLDEDCLLTASEILSVRRVPRLVFANACRSAQFLPEPTNRAAMAARSESLAGMIEAFFARGIENYIGTGWPIDDDSAVKFACDFYCGVLGLRRDARPPLGKPQPFAEAVGRARDNIRKLDPNQPTWGAFQFYGQPYGRLVEDGDDQDNA